MFEISICERKHRKNRKPEKGRAYVKNMSSGIDIDIALPGQDLGCQHFAMIVEELHPSRGTLSLYQLLLEVYKN